jgi:hypothetical protein
MDLKQTGRKYVFPVALAQYRVLLTILRTRLLGFRVPYKAGNALPSTRTNLRSSLITQTYI